MRYNRSAASSCSSFKRRVEGWPRWSFRQVTRTRINPMDFLHVLSNKSSTVDTPDIIEYMAKVATLAKPQSRLFILSSKYSNSIPYRLIGAVSRLPASWLICLTRYPKRFATRRPRLSETRLKSASKRQPSTPKSPSGYTCERSSKVDDECEDKGEGLGVC